MRPSEPDLHPVTGRWLMAMVAVLTAFAFALSYHGLNQVAVDAEQPLAWLWPSFVAAVAISMGVMLWRIRMLDQPVWPIRLGLYAVTGWTITCQVVTAPDNTFAKLVHGWPPFIALVMFELLVWVMALSPAIPVPDIHPSLVALFMLPIDDRLRPTGYRREEWPDRLDTGTVSPRRAALAAAVRNDPDGVQFWLSVYDNQLYPSPRAMHIDHVVPLAEAYRSGGWAWSADRRTLYANDPGVLCAASSSSNTQKGDRTPDRWRPSNQSAWPTYAAQWIDIKQRYGLTVTTSERDALSRMLEDA